MSELFQTLGLRTPALRFAALTAASGLVLTSVQPDLMFRAGAPRPWSVVSQEEDATFLPWYGAALASGFVAAQFF